MRGALPGLASPHPLGETLPSLYLQDAFAQALCSGLDESLAPLLCVLDNFAAYLDLATTPDDMLTWMSHWLGLTVTQDLPVARQRELLQVAAATQGWQGTSHGIRLALEAVFGVTVEIRDSGGSTWSPDPATALPGQSPAEVVVLLEQGSAGEEDLAAITAFVQTLKPAHVRHRVEFA